MVNRAYEGGIDKEKLSCKFSFRTTYLSLPPPPHTHTHTTRPPPPTHIQHAPSPHTHTTQTPPFPSHRCKKKVKVKDNLQQVLVS